MKVRLKLKPGQRGTKHLTRQYGDKLVCVRYRYDEKTLQRYTTVELIVDQEPWQPPRFKPDSMVGVRIEFDELEIREKARNAGGRWSKNEHLWKLPFKSVKKLGLQNRIVEKDNGKRFAQKSIG
jgi:hypothetical protein